MIMRLSHDSLNHHLELIEHINQIGFNEFHGRSAYKLCDSTYGNVDSERFCSMTQTEMQRFKSNTSPSHVWITPVLKWKDLLYAKNQRERMARQEIEPIPLMTLNHYDHAFLDAVHEMAKTQPELLTSSYFLSPGISKLIIQSKLQLHELYEMVGIVGITSYRLNIINVEQCLETKDRFDRFLHLSDQALINFLHRREYGL
jgi:hypothetical protein